MTLKQKLEHHYRAFDKTKISPDPLQFLHLFSKPEDIETAGLLSSVFAYGNVLQIIRTLNRIFDLTDMKPYEFVLNYNKKDAERLSGIKHRFYTTDDINIFFNAYKKVLKKYGSLENLFMKNYDPSDKNIKNALNHFSEYFKNTAETTTDGVKFMFPMPDKGSSCKRMNLFLRWMIRKDELDFGLWKGVTTDKLVIPVDTHIARICTQLGLTTRKNVSWKMAEEITDNLKKFDPVDPVKYDFAICHIGIRGMEF
jgi:uncharacterized protein (TIGR02757 family)